MSTSTITGINHLTLAVADVRRSVSFYRDLLGFSLRAQCAEGAYLEAGALWLCLSLDKVARTEPHSDYTHVGELPSSRRSGMRGCQPPGFGRITVPGSVRPQSTRIVQRKRRPT